MRVSALAWAVVVGIAATSSGACAETPVARERVAAAVAKLEVLAQQVIDRGDVPGMSIGIVQGDEVVYLKGFGVREVGKPDVVDPDTVFQLASCSKPVAATVVAGLVGDGVVSWDSRIAEIDPQFQLAEAYPTAQVTIADLFAHRSGLPGDAGNDLEALGFPRDEILRRLRVVPPAYSFRAGYSYSNFGLTAGALAAARAAGKPWEDLSEARLYQPLGMSSTSSRYGDFLSRADRAALHVKIDGAWKAAVQRDPDAQSPAGGVSSSARDMTRWLRLQLGDGMFEGKRIIAADALARSHLPVTARGDDPVTHVPGFYALGWAVAYGPQGVILGHAGAFSAGARTGVTLSPGARLGIVVLTNGFPNGVPEGLANSFFQLAFEGESTEDFVGAWNKVFASLFQPMADAATALYGNPPPHPTEALPSSAYVGTYVDAYVGRAAVAEADGGLVLRLGPGLATAYPLSHFDRDVFTYLPSPEFPGLRAAARFAVGADGRAGEVVLESVDAVGLGRLARVE